MGYVDELRELVGDKPLVLVRPTAGIVNESGQLLLARGADGKWTVPGGFMEPGESTEGCLRREISEEIGLELGELQLLGVFSGSELRTKLLSGHEYDQVVVAYICTEYAGEIVPEGVEVSEARFFSLHELPEGTDPYVRDQLERWGPRLVQLLKISN
ncbi:NUDIX domain-containing protein [Cohnella suwonensis]|uniref:NUDIX domain-containing protein n=1 Tax=Cohnella suwonensis TaxID=696072 RepID=A0ABW0M1I0_9BACL